MADAKAASKPETISFLGKECQVSLTDKGTTEKIVMSKGDFDAVLEEKGVTEAVRKVVKSAHDDIFKNALELSKDRLLTINKGKKIGDDGFVQRSYIVLGKGDGAMETTLDVRKVHNGKDIRTGEPYTSEKWAVFSGTIGAQIASDIRKEGGLISQIEDTFKKTWGPKKK